MEGNRAPALRYPGRGRNSTGARGDDEGMELVQSPVARAASAEVEVPVAKAKRIELLLALGSELVELVERSENDQQAGRLSGSFHTTKLPLLLKRVKLWLSAVEALGGRAPETVARLVEDSTLLAQHGSALVAAALEEIDEAIAGETLALPRRQPVLSPA